MRKWFITLLAVLAVLCLLAACEAAQDPTRETAGTDASSTAPSGTQKRPSASQTTRPAELPDDWPYVTAPPIATFPDRGQGSSEPPDFTIPPQPTPGVDEPELS